MRKKGNMKNKQIIKNCKPIWAGNFRVINMKYETQKLCIRE